MTNPTPTPDVNALIERLEESAEHLRVMPAQNGRQDVELSWASSRLSSAAQALRTLQARVGDAPERITIPRDIREQVLSMGRAEWGATAELNAAGHLDHLSESLKLTREHFDFDDVPVKMHGLYLEGTETVLCHTGTSPNSGANAQALTGAWNWLHDKCAATQQEAQRHGE